MTLPDPDETTTKALTTLGVGPAAAEAYRDLLGPAAREVGGNLLAVAKVLTVVLIPLHALVWGTDRIREWLSAALLKRMASVPPDDIVTPRPYVAGQALLQLTFCAEESHLRELYANLLAAAMNRRTANNVHPAFVQVIQQLTPDEAVLLKHIGDHKNRFSVEDEYGSPDELLVSPVPSGFQRVFERAGVNDPISRSACIDNLLRLRILTERQWHTVDRAALFFANPRALDTSAPDVTERVCRRIEVSEFGERFLATCVRCRE